MANPTGSGKRTAPPKCSSEKKLLVMNNDVSKRLCYCLLFHKFLYVNNVFINGSLPEECLALKFFYKP